MPYPLTNPLAAATINPRHIIKRLLTENTALAAKKRRQIHFDVDYAGKSLLNTEISKLYNRKFILSYMALADIIVTSITVIEKMIVLKTCGWHLEDLNEQLESGIVHWNNNSGSRIWELLQSKPDLAIVENTGFEYSFRKTLPATVRTQDGHMVRSKSEMLIDNFLFNNGLVHAYEKKLPVPENAYSDFWIPNFQNRPQSVYIELWGSENGLSCMTRKEFILGIYKRGNLHLIQLTDKDIYNLDDIFPAKLLQFGIKLAG